MTICTTVYLQTKIDSLPHLWNWAYTSLQLWLPRDKKMNVNITEFIATRPCFTSPDWRVSSHGIVVMVIATEAGKLKSCECVVHGDKVLARRRPTNGQHFRRVDLYYELFNMQQRVVRHHLSEARPLGIVNVYLEYVNHRLDMSINQSFYRSISQSINQSINNSIIHSINKTFSMPWKLPIRGELKGKRKTKTVEQSWVYEDSLMVCTRYSEKYCLSG